MTSAEKTALVEQILLRAAEQLGDVTAPVLTAYYERVPESKTAFEHHAGVNRSQLEGEMVENSLYCLMSWFTSPGEIEMLLAGSVPHHKETLQVPPHWYEELLEATAEVIAATIPADQTDERAAWDELRRDLRALIRNSAPIPSS